jgi:hypothetical protein
LKKFADNAIEKFNLNFPIYPNERLARIVSMLTFDGHLSKDGKVFLFTAGKKYLLNEPKLFIKREFGITGVYRKIPTNEYGTSYEYRVFNKPVSRILELIGVPKGNKMIVPFFVPEWVMNNGILSKAYLQTAFDCEGSVWKEGKRRLKIRFRINKSTSLIENGKVFVEEIKNMLSGFGIGTSETWIIESNIRKDGTRTKGICFNILTKNIKTFKKEIGFSIKHKRELLNGVEPLDMGLAEIA